MGGVCAKGCLNKQKKTQQDENSKDSQDEQGRKDDYSMENELVPQRPSEELEVFGEKLSGEEGYEDHGSVRDLGLSRLSRLSSQFLPASGCRIVQVPSGGFELRYSYLSQRGYYPEALDKANQDSLCVHTRFGNNPNDHFFGVFDGHGEYGAQCSQFAKQHLCENLLRNRSFKTDVINAYHAAFASTNLQLHRANIDDSMSGTTCITVLVRGRTLYVANVGDSRAVLAEKRDGDLVAVDVSSDQTPFREDECARVKQCGARVLTLDQLEGLKNPNIKCWGGEGDDDGDPPRLWVPNGMYPGTAFTRSVGDTVAERIGVIAVPEVLVVELNSSHPFFVVASDGVFEFLSSQAVVDMVARFVDPRDACAAIVDESYRLWLQYETRTDDITIIVVHIDGLHTVDADASSDDEPNLSEKVSSPKVSHDYKCQSTVGNETLETRPVRQDLSSARLRAIESSLDLATNWTPPSMSQPKTAEEKAKIKHMLQKNFLFHDLNDDQWQTFYDCLETVDVHSGEMIIRQGAEDGCFYIVASGEFEALISQGESNMLENGLGTVINHYTSEDGGYFGELALMYNKPRQASIRAMTDGVLWKLKREAFRGLFLMKYSNQIAVKYLRHVELLSCLSNAQLLRLADSLIEVRYQGGEEIVTKDQVPMALHIIHQGTVEVIRMQDQHPSEDCVSSQQSADISAEEDKNLEESNAGSTSPGKQLGEGSYFGEWILQGGPHQHITVVAVGNVVCWTLSRDAFESAVGSLTKTAEDETRFGDKTSLQKEQVSAVCVPHDLRELEWMETVYSTDCSTVDLVGIRASGQIASMKQYSLSQVKALGREIQVLREKSIIQGLSSSAYVPQLLGTFVNENHAGMLLNTCIAGPLSLILRTPLNEISARFILASVILALDVLHKDGVIYRGVSPDVLVLDKRGYPQLIDFRFAKNISNGRTFTICGMADFLAPEIITGQGHGFPADWWATGVLLYYMLQNELPFGSWRESELDVYAKIAKRQLALPPNLDADAMDLIDKLLTVDASERLGTNGVGDIKSHPWFANLNWDALQQCHLEVPTEISARLEWTLRLRHSGPERPSTDISFKSLEEDIPQWLEGW